MKGGLLSGHWRWLFDYRFPIDEFNDAVTLNEATASRSLVSLAVCYPEVSGFVRASLNIWGRG